MIAIALITVLFFLDKSLAGIENEILIRDLYLTEIGRDRRALSDLYNSIKSAVNPGLYNKACVTVACASDAAAVKPSCGAKCKADLPTFNKIINAVQACLSREPCGGSLGLWNLSSVSIPIALDGLNGQCNLIGNTVTATGGNQISQISEVIYPNVSLYQSTQTIVLTYNGLSINCTSCDICTDQQNSNSGSGLDPVGELLYNVVCALSNTLQLGILNCPAGLGGSSGGLLNNVLCLVDHLLNLGIFNCGQSSSTNSISSINSFQAQVTVTQTITFNTVFGWYSKAYNTFKNNFISSSEVRLGSGVPSNMQSTVQTAVANKLNAISIIDAIVNNYYTIFNRVIFSVFSGCLAC